MTDSGFDQGKSHEALRNMIQEYEGRKKSPVSESVIGALWFEAGTNKVYMCNGIIDGKRIWTCVN